MVYRGEQIDHVIDANGWRIPGDIISVDTETGQLERWKRDSSGNLVVNGAGDMERENVQLIPPVTVFFKRPQDVQPTDPNYLRR